MKWRARLACALALTILFLDTTVESVDAQVFIASNSRPEFWIAPLFVSANVTSEDVASRAGPVTMTVSWSVAPPPNRTPAEIAQDLYLLWPGEVPGTARSDGADPMLAREVEALGFKIKEHGVLRLSARSRSGMGTGAGLRTPDTGGGAVRDLCPTGRPSPRRAGRHLHPDPLETRVGQL